jgi:2-dehydro-3-deoxyphosphooctonate aldolase (KDO 8-P synthase)
MSSMSSGPDSTPPKDIFGPAPFLIAGPCVLESDELNCRVGDHLAEISERRGLRVIYKASFDKANRSNLASQRGPGLEEGLEALVRVRSACGLPVLTDVHESHQCSPVAEVADVLQIPAFLGRQTDLLLAAGATGRPVNVKKGQWMDVAGMARAVDKIRSTGCNDVAVTERGTFFGYGDLVVDMRNFARIRNECGTPAIYDATHAIQQPGRGEGGETGAQREFIAPLLHAAAGAGADGFFLETHPDPDNAPSDGPSMMLLDRLEDAIARTLEIWASVRDA